MTTAKNSKATYTAAESVKHIEDAVSVHKETIETVVRAGADAATKSVDRAVAMTKEQVEAAVKAGAIAFKNYEDMLQFSRENVEAVVKAGSIVAKGVQDLSHQWVVLAQASIDQQVAVGKALIGAKSIKEVVDLSSTAAKSGFDKFFAEGSKLSQASSKVAEEAISPLTSRVSAAVEKLLKTAA